MAALYADENFSNITVGHLRALGYGVLTALEDGRANRGLPDEEVLAFAAVLGRALLTINWQHFVRLHRRTPIHSGIIAGTEDPNFPRQAQRIDAAIPLHQDLAGQLTRVYRGL